MKPTSEAELWYTSGDWQLFAQAISSPIVQKGLSKILMQGLPTGAVTTTEAEALSGAERKGFFNFYREVIRLTVLPNKPQERAMAHRLQPDPIVPEEPTQ